MREDGSDADWFWVEFLFYYDQSLIRALGYVRREDGKKIADGVYQAGRLRRTRLEWTKRDEKWQVKCGKGSLETVARIAKLGGGSGNDL